MIPENTSNSCTRSGRAERCSRTSFFGINIVVFFLMAFAGGSTNRSDADGVRREIQRRDRSGSVLAIHHTDLHPYRTAASSLQFVRAVDRRAAGREALRKRPLRYSLRSDRRCRCGWEAICITRNPSRPVLRERSSACFGVLLVFGVRYRHSPFRPFFKRRLGQESCR